MAETREKNCFQMDSLQIEQKLSDWMCRIRQKYGGREGERETSITDEQTFPIGHMTSDVPPKTQSPAWP